MSFIKFSFYAVSSVSEIQIILRINKGDLRRGSGATIISSAGGAEFAMESKLWNNGLFTFCFLSGMKEMTADANKDGAIMLSEIEAYMYDKVSELSGGKQVPTARRENLEFDFRIW